MCLVAWGVTGLGDLIWETDKGRPLGMSTVRLDSRRDSRRLEEELCLSRDEEECLDEECLEEELLFSFSEWCLEELDDDLDDFEEDDFEDDFSLGTSRMFSTRPVVGSVVDDCPGSCETWYPSMM